ncbi:MAG: MogA/MoaB family molybdenum cofactor biosynthesis protein [Acidobacteria bacterium]|nr:MogA/MoaB family molybdenum cofactor biosynthesis protein [Acidobacteriota bacterium]
MGVHEHRASAPHSVGCAVLTISDTRTPDTDESGRLIRSMLEERGHRVVHTAILPDDAGTVEGALRTLLARDDVQAILLNGGTGISPRDRTFEAIAALLERRLDGFGEIFRQLSYREIGAAAMLSRAVAGLARGRVLFSMPGSTRAVRLAMESLILPEIGHVVGEAGKPERA